MFFIHVTALSCSLFVTPGLFPLSVRWQLVLCVWLVPPCQGAGSSAMGKPWIYFCCARKPKGRSAMSM